MAKASSKLQAAKRAAEKVKKTKKGSKKTLKQDYKKQGQNPPESKSYTEEADKKEPAKAVGYRWTTMGAKKAGKKVTDKVTDADIQKYGNKTFKVPNKPNPMSEDGHYRYLYSEKRVDKSDKSRTAKFAGGGGVGKKLVSRYTSQGQTAPQSSTYTEGADESKQAKRIGYRWTNEGAEKLGKKPTDRVTLADIKEYGNKTFRIKGKPSNYSTSHGGDGSYHYLYPEYRVDKSDKSRSAKFEGGGEMMKLGGKAKYVPNRDIKSITTESGKVIAQKDIFDGAYVRKGVKLEHGGEMMKGGGATKQTQGQYAREHDGRVDRKEDGKWMAKPVGYRYTDARAKSLRKDSHAVPTREHIDKYLGDGVYYENRRDKSDKNPTTQGNSFKTGGKTTKGFSGRYNSYKYNEGIDGDKTAKPVGFRFTDKLAKRLGKSPYARPTIADVQKYLGKGVYYEARQDKSDLNPTTSAKYQSLEHGGNIAEQNAEMVKSQTVEVKHHAEELANAMKANPTVDAWVVGKMERAASDLSDIAHYLDGKNKIASGTMAVGGTVTMPSVPMTTGTMARGGAVERIANNQAREYTENMIPFRGNNLEGKTLANGDYVVISYVTPIWWYSKKHKKWFGNSTKYSVTTSKQMSQSRPTYDAEMLSGQELERAIMAGGGFYEAGGALGNILASAGAEGTTNVGGTAFGASSLTPQLEMGNF